MIAFFLGAAKLAMLGIVIGLRVLPSILKNAAVLARYVPAVARAVAGISAWIIRHPWLSLGGLALFENRDLFYEVFRSFAVRPAPAPVTRPLAPPPAADPWQQLFGGATPAPVWGG